MRLPPGAIPLDAADRAILAAIADRRATVRSCRDACGLSISTTWQRLHRLRRLGVIAWEDGRAGTLHLAGRRVA